MKNKIKTAIVGYGNIGQYTLEAIQAADDFELVGIVRRNPQEAQPLEIQNIPVVSSIKELKDVEVAFLCVPTRSVKDFAIEILKEGIVTIDTFDIHSEILELRKSLDTIAKEYNTRAIVAAGWDPGSDSMVRTMMEAIVPNGITYTNFGPGMSMGHTVAVKAIEGVKKALSMTIPIGTGLHRRMVYIELLDGYNGEDVASRIKEDDYFKNDDTHVIIVSDVQALIDMGHGVNMTRKGNAGRTHNQMLSFDMKINNPALTAQVMICSARAAFRQKPGAYTLPEIPPIDLLPGDREYWINKLC